ncbi:Cell envelope-associated transcriptional attenuator LytR-CpsA-Psr, subfamily F2 [Dehalobacter sp. DCA]|jgi:cell envelope-related function transcriptional attenuator common domain|uniref:LCP family protein n=1 Tax=Dehalobacter sp. DCA TaxID=1147129 RepID=UPI00028BBA8A|nr:LCP family protein [Dehalobacter sp. DCA]AFV02106.1 Cell envelope-associated transcriptional attenuator LytR-CpsA-Psr, subfamily F2 [Dehalobacter sp. DCA]
MNKKIKKYILVGIGSLLIILAAMIAYYIMSSLNYKESLVKHTKQWKEVKDPVMQEGNVTDIGSENTIYMLFLGIDKTEERESWLGVYRTDTIILGKIDINTKNINLLSIPRDTYTYVPVENKFDKINHAYAYGSVKGDGVQASIEAVNSFMGKEVVDYYFLMNMEPIPSIVDEIGGVKIDVEIDMKDHGANLSKGLQVLNGQQAFDYIHWRYSAGGDIDRLKRQQKFLNALYNQQRESGKILETLNIVLKHKEDLQTNFTMKQMIGLTKFVTEVPAENVTYSYIPGRGQTMDGISYYMPYEDWTEELLAEYLK